MLSKLTSFIRQHELLMPGDRVVCAVSGGADSMALLWAMYLFREKLDITVEAAHFNHHLRGVESDRDENFVRGFCDRFEIPLHCGGEAVRAGEKGLEAAARDARYTFLRALPGKIATAHTADDNTETVLMHLVRGTGLRGLGGISPISGNVIRPMLLTTREDVESFLREYHIQWITDSSNHTDDFLRNRLRHHVMPLLRQENPAFSGNTSAMALSLRQEEKLLSGLVRTPQTDVTLLRQMEPALRARHLAALLRQSGVREPEAEHVRLAEKLVFSEKPSASARFPGGVTIGRNYDTIGPIPGARTITPVKLAVPGITEIPEAGIRITCEAASEPALTADRFTVDPKGDIYVRAKLPGDAMRTMGGTKTLKKLFIEKKIPAFQRDLIPVLADESGVLAVYGTGANLDRHDPLEPGIRIRFEKTDK